jgi:hypothetical protein
MLASIIPHVKCRWIDTAVTGMVVQSTACAISSHNIQFSADNRSKVSQTTPKIREATRKNIQKPSATSDADPHVPSLEIITGTANAWKHMAIAIPVLDTNR